jgi:hypothetical protein
MRNRPTTIAPCLARHRAPEPDVGSRIFAQQKNPERNVYYGETHLHTSWSFDAYAFGDTQTGPESFYQYATGKPTLHPGGYQVQITKPLDWGAVTEHAEYMGMVQEAMDPDSPLRKSSPLLARAYEEGVRADGLLAFKVLSLAIAKGLPIKEFSDPAVVAPVWKRVIDIADRYNKPGKFTTFAAYEWTSTPDSKNLHRNIFFRDSKKVPQVPFTPLDSPDPRDLWSWMDQQRAAGNDLLAISHNANLSNGMMFPTEVDHTGRPIDRAWAESRLRNEPLTEMKQVKGQSETTPGLSPNDEFANYEVFVWHLLGKKGPPPREYGSYVRQAYKDGVGHGAGTRLQSLQARRGRRLRLARQRRALPSEELLRRARYGRRHHRETHRRRHGAGTEQPLGHPCRSERGVGRGEHARRALRRDEAQGDLLDQRCAHSLAFLRRLGAGCRHAQAEGVGEGSLRHRASRWDPIC